MTRLALAPLLLVAALLLGLLGTGCVDPKAGDTGRTSVYVYDSASSRILVWDDVNTLFDLGDGATAPTPSRTIKSALLTNLGALAWGGMVFNPSNGELYLISEGGTVVRILKANSQDTSGLPDSDSGLSQITDIVSFTLGNSVTDRLSNSSFGQAALDPSTGTLYVTETGASSACRIWIVSNPGAILNGGQAPGGTYLTTSSSNDTGGYGLTVGTSGSVIAHFLGGQVVTDPFGTQINGARLRTSNGGSFDPNSGVLVGDLTELADTNGSSTTYATLAFDATYGRIYVARPMSSGSAVVVFTTGQFSQGNINQPPSSRLPDLATELPNLRILAHARSKDWMVGADVKTGTGTGVGSNLLRIWKAPSYAGSGKSQAVTIGTSAIRGLALDGSL